MLLNPLTFHLPKTTVQAAKLYKELEDAKVLAGGTFLLNSLKFMKVKGNKTAKNILSLSNISQLKGIDQSKDGITIGAMTTITELFEKSKLLKDFKILHTICRNISTTPIRNMATLGGNLTCRYTWTELPVAMIALDAQMVFLKPDGEMVMMKAEDFFKNNARSEFLFTHVNLKSNIHAKVAYRRVRKMSEIDQPLLTVCIKVDIIKNTWSESRVVINSGTAFAQRDYHLEEFLNGKESSETLCYEAMNHLTSSIYDTRSSEYKQYMFRTCIRQSIEEICQKD